MMGFIPEYGGEEMPRWESRQGRRSADGASEEGGGVCGTVEEGA
jgi:hypothetical protein